MITKKISSRCSTLAEALEAAIAHSGLEVLSGESKLYAMVSDFLRADMQGKQSLNLLKNAIEAGVPARIYGAIGKDNGTKNVTLVACRKLLMDSYGVSEEGAGQFVNSFATALGWEVTIENPVSVVSPYSSEAIEEEDQSVIDKEDWQMLNIIGARIFKEGNYARSAVLFRLAAEQGFANAQYNLALSYATGKGVEQDYAKAFKFYSLAADAQEDEYYKSAAICRLGELYENGYGVKQDYAKAIELYNLSLEYADNDETFYNLGRIYLEGKGVEQDYFTAEEYYETSQHTSVVSGDNPDILYYLGVIQENGYEDYDEAAEYYRLAAEQGHMKAQYSLANCYEKGKGVARNTVKAAELYRLAAAQGDDVSAMGARINSALS